MKMDLELDPREVLEHLNALGYYNVSKEQLKEFMKDLKRLIKYDTKKSGRSSSDVPVKRNGQSDLAHCFKSTKFVMKSKQHVTSNINHSGEVVNISTSDDSFQSIDNSEENDKENAVSIGSNKSKISCTLQCSKKNCSIHGVNSKSLAKRPHCIYCHSNCRQPSKEGGISKGEVSSICNCPRCRPESSKKEELPPCGSFIRPSSSSSRQGKSDPVALYHRYQSVWSQQNLPGENPHANLRWKIRHKMMGPNPSKIEERKLKTAPDRPPWIDS